MNEEIKRHMFTSIYKEKAVNTIQYQFILKKPHTSPEMEIKWKYYF